MKIDWKEIIEKVDTDIKRSTFIESLLNWLLVISVGLLLAFCLASLI